MASYIVKKNNRVNHDGVMYEPGQKVELTEEQAAQMPHAVELDKSQVPRTPVA